MTRILVMGAGSLHLALALRALDNVTRVVREPECFGVNSASYGWQVPPMLEDDPFRGGGRSKGEKKRAARERRMKGGY